MWKTHSAAKSTRYTYNVYKYIPSCMNVCFLFTFHLRYFRRGNKTGTRLIYVHVVVGSLYVQGMDAGEGEEGGGREAITSKKNCNGSLVTSSSVLEC